MLAHQLVFFLFRWKNCYTRAQLTPLSPHNVPFSFGFYDRQGLPWEVFLISPSQVGTVRADPAVEWSIVKSMLWAKNKTDIVQSALKFGLLMWRQSKTKALIRRNGYKQCFLLVRTVETWRQIRKRPKNKSWNDMTSLSLDYADPIPDFAFVCVGSGPPPARAPPCPAWRTCLSLSHRRAGPSPHSTCCPSTTARHLHSALSN